MPDKWIAWGILSQAGMISEGDGWGYSGKVIREDPRLEQIGQVLDSREFSTRCYNISAYSQCFQALLESIAYSLSNLIPLSFSF